jgi:hypothetical protein
MAEATALCHYLNVIIMACQQFFEECFKKTRKVENPEIQQQSP